MRWGFPWLWKIGTACSVSYVGVSAVLVTFSIKLYFLFFLFGREVIGSVAKEVVSMAVHIHVILLNFDFLETMNDKLFFSAYASFVI